MNLDLVNGLFETMGGLVVLANVRQLRKDKKVRGVNPKVTGFFWAWGLFNMIYYPSLGQWWSFAGGLVIAASNCAWLVLAIKYRNN